VEYINKTKLFIKELLELFWCFFIIGATLFGGGYAIIPVLERELIKKRKWTNMDEVMDYFAITQITPGIIAVNMATFIGFKRNGIAGGIAATLGLIIPGAALMIIISVFIKQAVEYEIIQQAFKGIRIAVCALILNTLVKLKKGVIVNFISVIFIIIAFILSVFFNLSPVLIIFGSVLAGLIFFYCSVIGKAVKPRSHEKKPIEKIENNDEEKGNNA